MIKFTKKKEEMLTWTSGTAIRYITPANAKQQCRHNVNSKEKNNCMCIEYCCREMEEEFKKAYYANYDVLCILIREELIISPERYQPQAVASFRLELKFKDAADEAEFILRQSE